MVRIGRLTLLIGILTCTWTQLRIISVPLSFYFIGFGVTLIIVSRGTLFALGALQLKSLMLLIILSTLVHLAIVPSQQVLMSHSINTISNSGSNVQVNTFNWIGITFSSGIRWLLSVFAAALASSILIGDKIASLSLISKTWLFGICINAAFTLIEFLGILGNFGSFSDGFNSQVRFSGLSTHPNILGTVALLGVPFVYSYFLISEHLILRVSQLLIIGLLFISIYLSGSRVCLFLFPVSVVMTRWYHLKSRRLIFAVSLGFGSVIFLLLYMTNSSLQLFRLIGTSRLFSENTSTTLSNQGRFNLFNQAISEISNNPFYGYGPAFNKDAHSMYLQLWVSLGLGGLVIFVWYVIRVLNFRLDSNDFSIFFLIPFKVSFLIFCLNNLVNNSLTEFYVYFPLGLLLSAKRLTTRVPRFPAR